MNWFSIRAVVHSQDDRNDIKQHLEVVIKADFFSLQRDERSLLWWIGEKVEKVTIALSCSCVYCEGYYIPIWQLTAFGQEKECLIEAVHCRPSSVEYIMQLVIEIKLEAVYLWPYKQLTPVTSFCVNSVTQEVISVNYANSQTSIFSNELQTQFHQGHLPPECPVIASVLGVNCCT